MSILLSRFLIADELGVIQARQSARKLGELLGLEARSRAEIACAVTHVACEAIRHAGGALVEFGLEGDSPRSLECRVFDRQASPMGPGTGHPRDLDRPRRLMDRFEEDDDQGLGFSVKLAKLLPPADPGGTAPDAARIAEELREFQPTSPVNELLDLDESLLVAFGDLQARGLELDERAESLRRASEFRTRLLSGVSHELRTPLTSILGLARLLLDRADGELTVEQERQVSYIIRASEDLKALVNDLIDLARIEAGREVVGPSEILLAELFAELQATVHPFSPPTAPLSLVFEEPEGIPAIRTDRAKLSLILRNFLSNALKFTENGEIRLKAERGSGDSVALSVSDTGIGIAKEHHERIFEEFAQLDSPLGRLAEGSGLGLPMARQLARILGGEIHVRSEPGVGSTFTLTIPIRHPGDASLSA